jgi:hypothetical protein
VGYWKFDQGSGTSPTDSSGENVSGSFTATQPTWSTDVPSTQFSNPYSLDFTRTGDAVTIAWPTSLNFSNTAPRSFSFWYKPTGDGETASGNYDRIISWSDDKYEIAGTFGDVSVHRLAFYDGSWRDTGFNMSVGTWYNITFTYDGTNVKLYVNNVERFSGTSEGRALSGTMYIGTRYTGDEGINGRIDDVRVYDRALTLSEIQNISEGGSGPGVPTPTPTLTPTPASSQNSNTNSFSSTTTNAPSFHCTQPLPRQSPDLFQVSTTPTSATLYFTPTTPSTGYTISYGNTPYANHHAVSFNYADTGGVIAYTIHELLKETRYYFKVQAKNLCAPGSWSRVLTQTTSATTHTPAQKQQSIKIIDTEQKTQLPQETVKKIANENKTTDHDDGYALTIKVVQEGKPVEGALVEIHSTPRQTTTDKDGIARFSDVEKGKHTVYLTYGGYKGKETIDLTGDNKEPTIQLTVEMTPNTPLLYTIIIGSLFLLLACIILLVFYRRVQ